MMVYITYLKIEFKRYIKLIPYLTIVTLALTAVLIIVGFFATKAFENNKAAEKKDIYFTSEDNSKITKVAVKSLSTAKSLTALFNIKEVDYENLQSSIKNDDMVVCISVPKNFLKGLINGDNNPIDIYYSSKASIYSLIITEMSQAAQVSLQSAQAAIYALYDYYEIKGNYSYADDAAEEMDFIYLRKALSREGIFEKKHVSPFGKSDSRSFYVSTGILTVIMLLGCVFILRIKSKNSFISKRLSQSGIKCWFQILCEILSITVVMYIVYMFFALMLLVASKKVNWLNIRFSILAVGGIIICFLCACIVSFVASIIKSRIGAMLALFIAVIASEFISGAFLPTIFLPNILCSIDKYLPTRYLFEFTRNLVAGYISFENIYIIMLYMLLFAGSSLLFRGVEQ